MGIFKEILADNKKFKAVILKSEKTYEIQLFKYFPECVDEEGDTWEEFWQEITYTKTITDTEQNAIKLAKEELSLLK
ncbi:hypothetical protein [Mesobacillus selenatarsenatis]|uniref:Uncharacterized protein n=1 Tax=Mesobacillus selenatarsenatis (strain DSM 18680 / JCM 14380 / FERM P-15431 / SF-1) TaxID=1321606 RepID=A0A0A8X0B3_MESS1|nr:hypothetical protein [Mesobacillus selenatarsenatis]GAM12437.1 hypothetical protein SAMD00020551_0571 [Mesobacillus selenatarsenatis SF-1]